MSEETKVRLMVIPIVAMLAVTIIVAGWHQEDEQVEIDVDDPEAFDEFTISNEYVPAIDENTKYPQNYSVATVYINNESYLEFEVEPNCVMTGSRDRYVNLNITAESSLEEELDPEKFLITVEETEENLSAPENTVSFQYDVLEEDGLSRISGGGWDVSRYDVKSNEFDMSVVLQWKIIPELWEEDLTLELDAILEGLSEEVSTTIHVHLEGDE